MSKWIEPVLLTLLFLAVTVFLLIIVYVGVKLT